MKNKKFITSKISIKILLISIVFISSTIIFAVWNNYKFKDKVITSTKNNLSVKSEIIATGIEKLLLEFVRISQLLAKEQLLINILTKHDHEFRTGYCSLENIYLLYNEDIDVIMLIADDGTLLHRYPVIEDSLQDYSSREDIDYVLQNHSAHISGIYFNTDRKPAVAVSHPVFYQDKFIGIIRFVVLVETFIDQFISPALDENTFAIAIDNQGKLFYKPYSVFKGKTVYDLLNEDRAKYPDHDFSERQEILIKSVRGETGSAIYYLTDNTGEFTKMIMAYHPINIIDGIYSISLYTNYNPILQPAKEYAIKLVAFILLIVIMFAIITIFLFRILIKHTKLQTETIHLKNIAEKTEEIIKQKNEFETLYEDFKSLNTELVIAKEKVEESEEKYKLLTENSTDVIWTMDLDFNYQYLSPSSKKITNYSLEERKRISDSEIFTEESLSNARTVIDDLLKIYKNIPNEAPSFIFELEGWRKNKAPFFAEVVGSFIIENGQIIGLQGATRDITQRKKLENELIAAKEKVEKSEIKYRTLVENQGEGLIMANLNETITFANPAAERIFETDKLVGINLGESVLGDQMQLIKNQTKDRVKGEKSSYELDIELENNIKKSLLVTATPIFEGEKVIKTLGLFRDITELKTIEKNLIKLTTAVEQSANMIVITDAEGIIEYVNKEFSKVSGYLKNEVIGKNPNILKSGKHSDEFYQKLWRTIKSKKEWRGEINNKKKNGELYWESAIIAPVLNNNGDIINFIIIKEDITERKLYEKKMFDAIVKTEEREKKRFAADLHDGLGPILSAAKIYAEALKSENNPRVKKQILKKFEQVINEAIDSTQEIANNISPHILKNFGLTAAINSFCNKISGTLIAIGVESNTENRFNENVEISVYRVLIELINNTLKHADASLIKINIKEIKQDLFIRYMDNGVGFDVKKILDKSKGMGIKNIINRINFINGKIKIKSDINKGTVIEIILSVKRTI